LIHFFKLVLDEKFFFPLFAFHFFYKERKNFV